MSEDPRPGGLAALYRQKSLVYASMTRVFDAEDAGDWKLVETCIADTRRHLKDWDALFADHQRRAEGDEARAELDAVAADFGAMRSSYARVLDSMAARARDALGRE